jgi:dipeptidyl aminopeptidase/acylaminoacyl peptidase
MANHDYIISNQTFPSFRTDLNNSLSAIASNNSSASEPATTYAYQWWYDTNNDQLKIRNRDNDAWITVASFNQTTNTITLVGTYLQYLPTITSISPDTIDNNASNVVITGTNFVITPNVEIIASTGAITYPNSITRDSATQLTINVTLPTDGTYFIRVENPDGLAVRSSTALLTVSDAPTWTTPAGSLGSVASGSTVSLSVAGTSDSTVAYSETTAVLTSDADTPNSTMNLSLNSSTGAITGTAPEPTAEKVYNFTLRLTDAESQTTDRAFSITVTTGINNGGQFN